MLPLANIGYSFFYATAGIRKRRMNQYLIFRIIPVKKSRILFLDMQKLQDLIFPPKSINNTPCYSEAIPPMAVPSNETG